MDFFTHRKTAQGVFECRLDLAHLYTKDELSKFWLRYKQFCAADRFLQKVIRRKGNTLVYTHKSWIPVKVDKRPRLLFLFGNPAPHSVLADIYFAYEGNGREHRFWKVMRELNVIDIAFDKDKKSNFNGFKSRFFNLEYTSPFLIGMEVLFTFPSPTSDPKWSGVMGLQKLFGKKTFDKLAAVEKERMGKVIKSFLSEKGKIVVFQKDAYNGLLDKKDEQYEIKKALAGKLLVKRKGQTFIGIPPTRWMHTRKFKDVLKKALKS